MREKSVKGRGKKSNPAPDPPGAAQQPDIHLDANSVDKSKLMGVLAPPENPLAQYEAVTDACELKTVDDVSTPVPLPVPDKHRSAEWRIEKALPGPYSVFATYTSDGSRPLSVYIDGEPAIRYAFTSDTLKGEPDWRPELKLEENIGYITLSGEGPYVLCLRTEKENQSFPHVHSLTLRYLPPQ